VLSQCDIEALAFVFAWALEASSRIRPARPVRVLNRLIG
jgi:hypothetical protein